MIKKRSLKKFVKIFFVVFLVVDWILTGLPQEAKAAFGTGTATCTAQSKIAGTSLTCTVATANFAAGDIAVLWFAGDNTATVDGNDGLLSSVTDSASNTWTVQRCFTNGQGAAAAGATTCIAWSKLTTGLTSGSGTITANFSSITAKAIVTKQFTVAAGNTIQVAGTPQDLANDALDPGSMVISGLTSAQYLFVRSSALERATGGTWTVTANYTTSGCNGTTGGTATNMETCGEFRIFTGTGDTSNPTATAVDNANIFIAFQEVAQQPTFTQNNYRWYVHPSPESENVTDPWPSGAIDLAENTAITITPFANDPPDTTQTLRLRVNFTVGTANLAASAKRFKLQYRTGTDSSCSTGTWTDVNTGNAWVYATSTVTDGTTLTVAKITGTNVLESYVKARPSVLNPNSATTSQNIEYDFHIVGTNAVSATRYLFRAVETDAAGTGTTVFSAYTNCAILSTEPGTGDLMRHGNVFAGEAEQGFFWAN